MLKRVITALVCLVILIPVLIFSDTWVFIVALGLLALLAVYEITGCIGVRRKYLLSIPSYLFTAVVIFLMTTYFMEFQKFIPTLFVIGYVYLFLIFTFTMFSCGNIKFSQAAELVAVTCYIIIGFLSIVFLRGWPNAAQSETGKYLYLLVFIGAWMTDTGAYFAGVLFGKHKLIPAVSPKKTVEGAVGGIFGCILGYGLYGLILEKFFSVTVHYPALLLLAALIAVVSQLGDLIASYIKRECDIKDFGFIFPGHGGVMDRFDSIIAVAPVLYGITLLLPDTIRIFG